MNQTVMKTKRQSNNGTVAKINKVVSNDEDNHR